VHFKEAIIVAGASLNVIQKDIALQTRFIDLATKIDVVLACRVSPKQKAEIVKMIK